MSKASDISVHIKNGKAAGYKKFIMGRVFYLGADEVAAKKLATILVGRAAMLKALGEDWTDEIVEDCRQMALGVSSALTSAVMAPEADPDFVSPFGALPTAIPQDLPRVPQPLTPQRPVTCELPPPRSATTAKTLYEVMAIYNQHQQNRAASKQVGQGYADACARNITRLQRCLPDMPMVAVDMDAIDKAVAYWCARPANRRPGGQGTPISVATVQTVLTEFSGFLDWCDARNHWIAPRRWKDCFKIKPKKLMTPEELKNTQQDFKKYSVEDAQILWGLRKRQQNRIYLGLGIWCGWTQTDISSCLLTDLEWSKNGELHIDKNRSKTGVRGRWWIPPELAALIRWEVDHVATKRKNPGGLAFLNEDGGVLTPPSGRGCNITRQWQRWSQQAHKLGTPKLSFKFLRKTLSKDIRDVAGAEMAQMFLSHKDKSVMDSNYAKGSFDNLEKVIREQIYPRWQKMFAPIDIYALAGKVREKQMEALSPQARAAAQCFRVVETV